MTYLDEDHQNARVGDPGLGPYAEDDFLTETASFAYELAVKEPLVAA